MFHSVERDFLPIFGGEKTFGLGDSVFSVVVIGQFVSPIKFLSAYSAMMFGQLSTFEPLMPTKVRHPLVSFPAFSAHIVLHRGDLLA